MRYLSRAQLQEEYGIKIWDDQKIQAFQTVLLDWYDNNQRPLPWRLTKDPYKIWVSEIMLQQTRVETVIPYYENFLKKFPTIKDLAQAPVDEVLKAWQGLGYYSRARNLQEAAKQILLHYSGKFPEDPVEIIKLKGIGPYTCGAIASIAFSHPIPAVDGNLMRVIARLFEIDLDIAEARNKKVFESVAKLLISVERPGDFNQALMDIGATVSTPKVYNAQLSPIKEFDQSFLNDTWRDYPVKKSKKKPKNVSYLALIIKNEKEQILLEKRPDQGLLANMWTFPLIEVNEIEMVSKQSFSDVEVLNDKQINSLSNYIANNYYIDIEVQSLQKGYVNHIFSHLNWAVNLFEGQAPDNQTDLIPDQCEWVYEKEFNDYVFPKLQEKMWEAYQQISLF